jgi:hypothetical protein
VKIDWDDVRCVALTQNGAAAAGGTGIAFSRLTVPPGEIWRVDFGIALHDDDGGARVLTWNYYDGAQVVALDGGQSLAAGVRYQLYGGLITGTVQGAIAVPEPLVLNRNGYIEARVGAAMVDGHLVNLSAIVRKIKGVV